MSLLKVIRWKKATGLILGEDRLTIARVASTAAGIQTLDTEDIEYGEEGVRGALESLVENKKLAGLVVAGLPAHRVYFAAKPSDEIADAADVLEVLPPALSAGSKYVFHQVTLKGKKQTYTATGACQKDIARDVLAGLEDVKATRLRLEPAPLSLFAAARNSGKMPRRWRNTIRILLDGGRGLAFLAKGKRALAWRPFRYDEEDPGPAVATSVRGLRTFGRADLALDDVDGLIVHTAGDRGAVESSCEEYAGIETKAMPPVALDSETAAAALGAAGLKARSESPDMLQRLKPPPSIRDIFPWGVAALLSLAVLGTGYQLSEAADLAEHKRRMAVGSTRKDAKKAKVKVPQLKKRHKELALEMELVYNFIVKRVSWAEAIRDLPPRLSDSVGLYGIRGRCSFTMPSNTKTKIKVLETKELVLMGRGRIPRGQAAPEEITQLLESIAQSDVIKKDFPRVDGATVTRKPGKKVDAINFVARCSKPKW